jgi:hypothetical protein
MMTLLLSTLIISVQLLLSGSVVVHIDLEAGLDASADGSFGRPFRSVGGWQAAVARGGGGANNHTQQVHYYASVAL